MKMFTNDFFITYTTTFLLFCIIILTIEFFYSYSQKSLIRKCMNINFRISVRSIPESLGGGYQAFIKDLGSYAFVGDGETPEQALKHLRRVQKDLFEMYFEQDKEILLNIIEKYKGE